MEIHLQVIDHVVAMKKVIVGQKVSEEQEKSARERALCQLTECF